MKEERFKKRGLPSGRGAAGGRSGEGSESLNDLQTFSLSSALVRGGSLLVMSAEEALRRGAECGPDPGLDDYKASVNRVACFVSLFASRCSWLSLFRHNFAGNRDGNAGIPLHAHG
eukprot:6199318-Pleurochrysis_carterae.AAC.1